MGQQLPALLVCWVLVAAVRGGSASAQSARDVDVEHFVPAFDRDGLLGIPSTRSPGTGQGNVALWADYSSDLIRVRVGSDGSGARRRPLDDRYAMSLWGYVGLSSRLAVALRVPWIVHQHGQRVLRDEPALPARALGDCWLYGLLQVAGPATRGRDERQDGPGLGLLAGVALPAGQPGRYAGEGSGRFELRALADFHLLGASLATHLGWLHRTRPKAVFATRVRDRLGFGIGLKLPLLIARGLAGLIELRGTTDAGKPFAARAGTSLVLQSGLRASLGELTFTVAVARGLVAGVGSPAIRATLGVSWAPRSHDQDEDGLDDDVDACPPLPEDLDGFQDDDGCPDPDNDNDLVPDVDDLCPNEEAEEGRDQDEDGCTDPPST
ncbi:MAG: hypothetical protein MJD61_10935 [Proteobacteria bacterium]|nr:hypothetical protein [Pseudomonadota bacterium]